MAVNWKAFTEQISHYESFDLVSHIRPDCDALGSELGMAEVHRAVGKKVRIINAHRTPPALQFLDPAGNIEVLGHHRCRNRLSPTHRKGWMITGWMFVG